MHGLTGIGMDVFNVFIRTQTLIGSVAIHLATEMYEGYKGEKLNIKIANLKGRYFYAAASDMLQILNEVGWVAPMKKLTRRTEQSNKILGLMELLLPEPRQQELDPEKQISKDVWEKKFDIKNQLVYKSAIEGSEFVTNVPDLVFLLFFWASKSKKIQCLVDIEVPDSGDLFVDKFGNLLTKEKLERIDNSWFQLKMVHSDFDDAKTVPEAITSLLSIKRDEYGSLNHGGFSFENMVADLDMSPQEIRSVVYDLRSKTQLNRWAKEHFSVVTDTENAEKSDQEEYNPDDDKSNESTRGKGASKKSNKEVDTVEKPFYFPQQGRFALSKADKSRIFPASRTVSTIREATPKIDEAIMIHMEKAVRLSVARAAGHMIDPNCEDHKEFSTEYFENADDNILAKQDTIAKGLSQDFAALVVAVGKFAISSTMNATDDRNPLTAAKNVRNSSVDLSPIQTQLAWISEGLCRDKEAAKLITNNRRLEAKDFISTQSSDTVTLQKLRLYKRNQTRELKYLRKLPNVIARRQYSVAKKLLIDFVETTRPLLPEHFEMYTVCNVFDKSHPFYEKFERLSWEQGVPPPEVDFRGLDDKFQAYLQFCDEYKSDPENFDLKNPDFLALIQFFMDYPVSFVPSYCSIPSIQLKFAGTTSCKFGLINSIQIHRNGFL